MVTIMNNDNDNDNYYNNNFDCRNYNIIVGTLILVMIMLSFVIIIPTVI